MRTVFKRLRGAIGTALTWAAAFPALGLFLDLTVPAESGVRFGLPWWAVIAWAINGAIGGLVFALLTATDGRRSLRQFSLKRSAMWGLFSAIAVPLSFESMIWIVSDREVSMYILRLIAAFGAAGASSAAGMVWIARRVDAGAPQEPTFAELEQELLLSPAPTSFENFASQSQAKDSMLIVAHRSKRID